MVKARKISDPIEKRFAFGGGTLKVRSVNGPLGEVKPGLDSYPLPAYTVGIVSREEKRRATKSRVREKRSELGLIAQVCFASSYLIIRRCSEAKLGHVVCPSHCCTH